MPFLTTRASGGCKSLSVLLALALLSACSTPVQPPQGLASFDEVRDVAEDYALRGNSVRLLKHIDVSGIPAEKAEEGRLAMGEWRGVPAQLKHVETEVLTFDEHEALDQKEPPLFRSTIRWNIPPEKILVFHMVSRDPEDKTAKFTMKLGAHQAGGEWFFSAAYK